MDIQNHGPQSFWEVTERGLTRFSAFLHVFPDDTANWIYVTINARNPIEANALPDVWNIFQEKTISSCKVT